MYSASTSIASFKPPPPPHSIFPPPPQKSPNHHLPHFSTTPLTVPEKLNTLVTEFKSLSKPIDRVKRLLHYATILPEFDESGRVESNRVTGCTAQVWLNVAVDAHGLMRFHVDSDSEITKGFCYCLIWLLDGADPCDVVGVKVDDLGDMNVGVLPVRVSSRVNTWHNVLISMQRRTRELVVDRCGDCESFSLLQ
ncbi:putative Fe-S metabolism associated domain, SufE [Helianthus annuus]|nr:putative Fe-S metabolism associated domain, SufE [Helianthus annuus]KAJ0779896.1 putative Fe-S metabolism associated domain, SufE [Helianthus annuus]